jgi:hypothetical protein
MSRKHFILLWVSILLPLVLLAPLVNAAEQTDITFIVAGKTANHRQDAGGNIRVLNYHFFAEIFIQPDGEVTEAGMLTPLSGGEAVPFADSGYALEMHGGRYKTEAELEAEYPDGEFVFQYTTPGTGRVRQVVELNNQKRHGSGLPAPPRIMLSQNGKSVAPSKVDPNYDLLVNWSEFSDGSSDPLNIMDDLLFVILGDCDGVRQAHSGRPFENTPYLTYADTLFVIEAEKLKPENAYQLLVEHAVLDTSKQHGVIGFATFASTTFLDVRTTGKAAPGEACGEIRKNFDAGQEEL